MTWSVKPIKPRGRTMVFEDCDQNTVFSAIADSYAYYRFGKRVRSKSIHFAVIDPHGARREFVGYRKVETAPVFDVNRVPTLAEQEAEEIRQMTRRNKP
ncbi:MAG TPA: hypothetical protein VGK73_31520 [Polyangiaceae bacterium]